LPTPRIATRTLPWLRPLLRATRDLPFFAPFFVLISYASLLSYSVRGLARGAINPESSRWKARTPSR